MSARLLLEELQAFLQACEMAEQGADCSLLLYLDGGSSLGMLFPIPFSAITRKAESFGAYGFSALAYFASSQLSCEQLLL